MPSLEPKKLALLRIWQILQKHSDYDHPLTQEDIIKYLEKDRKVILVLNKENLTILIGSDYQGKRKTWKG